MIFGETKDPLQEVLAQRGSSSSLYSVARSHSNFFKSSKFNYEYLGMSITQRIVAFIISLGVASILFITALYRMFFILISPTGFVLPYALSNILFFIMFGFVSGFKTHAVRLLSKDKRAFTIAFIAITALTLYAALTHKSTVTIFFFGIVQLFAFIAFVITFLPGGSTGLISLLNLAINR